MSDIEAQYLRYTQLVMKKRQSNLTAEDLTDMEKIRQKTGKTEEEILLYVRERLTGEK